VCECLCECGRVFDQFFQRRGVAKKVDPEMQRLKEQMEADKRERLANGPITKSSGAIDHAWNHAHSNDSAIRA
jgi:hypothetical protein